eukprot:CAMPEP_0196688236 /NCGR_PEP_ID=MMETSP1090-20130531/15875_1 /TAXON_ID=37098 /ORGANISM="Isochrysis sp, Strain CCMP1244" /LENGTH=89 /DNA_ID=CAMNT_0042027107 /DNA_START=22 /DNA_END=290 /DNA_ORIENTATION=-
MTEHNRRRPRALLAGLWLRERRRSARDAPAHSAHAHHNRASIRSPKPHTVHGDVLTGRRGRGGAAALAEGYGPEVRGAHVRASGEKQKG